MVVIFWLLLTLVDTKKKIEWLARVIVLSGLFQALVAVLLMATGTSFQLFFVEMDAGRAHGTFVSPNHFAGYIEMTLAVGIGLMIAKLDGRSSVNWRQRLHSWMAILLSGKAMLRLSLIIMVVGLVASRSRMGNSAFFASLLIAGLFTVIVSKYVARNVDEKSAKNKLHATVLFILSLVILDVVIIGGMVGVEKVVQRIENTNLEMKVKTENQNNPIEGGSVISVQSPDESLELRVNAAKYAMQIVQDFPWLGTGGGTFFLAFQHYRPFENYGYYDHAHNDYVEIASESGLIGLALLAVILFHSVRKSVRIMINGQDQLSRGMVFASLMGITSLFIHGFVDFNLQIPANAMMFVVLLSIPYLLRRTA
jgi:O-antigen ligase